jgi:hypothetical protein
MSMPTAAAFLLAMGVERMCRVTFAMKWESIHIEAAAVRKERHELLRVFGGCLSFAALRTHFDVAKESGRRARA